MTISETCDARFTRVKDAFVEGFTARGELGAAVAIEIDDLRLIANRSGPAAAFPDHADAWPARPDAVDAASPSSSWRSAERALEW